MGMSSQSNDDSMVEGINVTPLVDITLVLLIIFMVTAKIIVSQAMPLDLPKAASGKEVQMVFSVELRSNGDLVVDGKKLPNAEALLPLAKEAQVKTPDLRAVIRAESSVQHGRVMQSLDMLKKAGVTKIAFGVTPVTDADAAPAAPTPAPVTP